MADADVDETISTAEKQENKHWTTSMYSLLSNNSKRSAQRCPQGSFGSSVISNSSVVLCCLLLGKVGTLLLRWLASVMPRNPMFSLAYCFVFNNLWCILCPSKKVFDLSDEDITMFSLSAMLFHVVSSLLVCLHGTRPDWSCLAIYPFKIDYDSTCICGSLHIACCISLMVRAVGRQVRTIASIKFSVSISKALISSCMFLVCLER